MKGLVLKDLYYLRGFARQYALILLCMAVWSFMVKNSSFVITYLLVIGNTLLLSTSSMDEAVSFNRFALTMPVNRKMLVQSKYILLFLIEAGVLFFGIIIGVIVDLSSFQIHGAARWTKESFEWPGIITLFALFMIISCITLPAVFKLGVEKARHIYMMTLFGLAILVFGGLKLCQVAGISLDFLNHLEEIPEGEIIAVLLAVCVGAAIISYQVSLKMVENKEW